MPGEKSGEATSGNNAGGLIPIDLVELEKQIKALQSIIDQIDAAGDRSIIGEIDNLTESALTLVHFDHESGAFTNDQPTHVIGPHNHGLFGSKNTFPSEGTVGSVTYQAGDGTEFLCGWSNPFIGDGKINFIIRGAHPARYGVFATPSGGNKRALRRWVIFPLPGPFSVKAFLRAHRVNRILAIQGAKGNSLRGLMGL